MSSSSRRVRRPRPGLASPRVWLVLDLRRPCQYDTVVSTRKQSRSTRRPSRPRKRQENAGHDRRHGEEADPARASRTCARRAALQLWAISTSSALRTPRARSSPSSPRAFARPAAIAPRSSTSAPRDAAAESRPDIRRPGDAARPTTAAPPSPPWPRPSPPCSRPATDVDAIVGIGGGGGTSIVTAGMRALPFGVPKLMVSTLASGDVGALRRRLRHHDDARGRRHRRAQPHHPLRPRPRRRRHRRHDPRRGRRPTTKPARRPHHVRRHHPVRHPRRRASSRADYDCLVFHATGTGGRTLEMLADSGMLAGVIDVTTTEIADELVGGVLTAGPDRLGAIARTRPALRRLARRPRHGELLGAGDHARPLRRAGSSTATTPTSP